MTDTIRVVVSDSYELYRQGIAHVLGVQEDIEVVGQAGTVEETVRLACEASPDILLLDGDLPGSIEVARSIGATCPASKIIVLTASEDDGRVVAALRTGVRGYVLKRIAAQELIGIVRMVHRGGIYVTPALSAGLLAVMTGASSRPREPAGALTGLTPREHQILERVAAGHSNGEIAQKLRLSEKTVKHHMTRILQKLGVRNRVEAALVAREHGSTAPQN